MYNTGNYAAETNDAGVPVTNVTSNIVRDATLDTIEMWIAINDTTYWPESYGDFVAYIFEASADGLGPVGAALASGRIEQDDIIAGGLDKAYTITMRDAAGEKIVLKAGKQYVVCLLYTSSTGPRKWPIDRYWMQAAGRFRPVKALPARIFREITQRRKERCF